MIESAAIRTPKQKALRHLALFILVFLGLAHPLSRLFDVKSEWLLALNASPHHTVFAGYPFFSEISVTLIYADGAQRINTTSLYRSTNMYSGKLIYSLFYMSYIFKSRRLSDRITAWYFCNAQNLSSDIPYLKKLKTIEISYVHRGTKKNVENRHVTCDEDANASAGSI